MKKIILFFLTIFAATAHAQTGPCEIKQVKYLVDSFYDYKEDSCYYKERRNEKRQERLGDRYKCDEITKTGVKKVDRYKDTLICTDATTTNWGIKIQRDKFENQLSVAKQLGVKTVRPNSIGISEFAGDLGNLLEWHNAGFFTIVNINWLADNTQKPFTYLHGSDTIIWKIKFESLCKKIKDLGFEDSVILVIENEPANDDYYVGETADYIHQLSMSIIIAHKYGIKIADGCTHLELIELVRTGKMNENKNGPQTRELLTAYKSLNLDYVTFHCSYQLSSKRPLGYPVTDFVTTIDYLRKETGKQVICNEYSIIDANAIIAIGMVEKLKPAKVPYIVPWSGDGVDAANSSKASPYNVGVELTDIGKAYRDAIK